MNVSCVCHRASVKITLADTCATLRRASSREHMPISGIPATVLWLSVRVHTGLPRFKEPFRKQPSGLRQWDSTTEIATPTQLHRVPDPGATHNRNNAQLCLPSNCLYLERSGPQAHRNQQFGRKPAFCKPQGQEVHTHQRVPTTPCEKEGPARVDGMGCFLFKVRLWRDAPGQSEAGWLRAHTCFSHPPNSWP